MRLRTWLSRERGQSLVIVALLLVVLVGALGLVVDVGNLYAQRRFMQNAADAAALAGARVLALDEPVSDVEDAIQRFAVAENGAQTVESEVDVANGTVAVTVTKVVPSYFMGVMGIQTNTVAAAAQAGNCPVGKPGGVFPFGVQRDQLNFEGTSVVWDSDDMVDPTTLPGAWDASLDSLILSPNYGWVNLPRCENMGSACLKPALDEDGFDGIVELGTYGGTVGLKDTLLGEIDAWSRKYYDDDTDRSDKRLDILVPIYDSYTVVKNSEVEFHITGFATFHIYEVVRTSKYKYIWGQFRKSVDVEPQTRCGTADYGTRIVQLER